MKHIRASLADQLKKSMKMNNRYEGRKGTSSIYKAGFAAKAAYPAISRGKGGVY